MLIETDCYHGYRVVFTWYKISTDSELGGKNLYDRQLVLQHDFCTKEYRPW